MNTERLIFRHYAFKDFNDYLDLVSNLDLMKIVTGHPLLKTEARNVLERCSILIKSVQKLAILKFH